MSKEKPFSKEGKGKVRETGGNILRILVLDPDMNQKSIWFIFLIDSEPMHSYF